MLINKISSIILLTFLLKSTPSYSTLLHQWVDTLDDTLESALILRPKVKNFINKFTPDPYDGGRGSRFYVGGALLSAIRQNKLHLAYVFVEYKPDYRVRGNSDDERELNIFHFCAHYLPDTTQSVAFIKHIVAESDAQIMLSLLNDSQRWQRSEMILPLQLAEKHKKDKIAQCFKNLQNDLQRQNILNNF